MKRSNRLVMLIGVFLAVVAFVLVIVTLSGGSTGDNTVRPPTTGPVVIATADIPLSTKVKAEQVTTKTVDLTAIEAGAFTDVSQVIGKVVRAPVSSGAQLTGATFGDTNSVLDVVVPAGHRAISVQVDQVSGVGTVIKTGDYVDLVAGFQGSAMPVVIKPPLSPDTNIPNFGVVQGLNNTSVKVLLQGMQVLGTLLPAPTDTSGQPAASGEPGTTLNGQQEIVILSVTAQQAEVIKFAQLDGSISLVLRSADDFIDPVTGEVIPVIAPDDTFGVILKTLVDKYGVVPPELVETRIP